MDALPTGSLVLVVDDDVRSARVLVRMLQEEGFEVELAADGAAAISRLGRDPCPDVLVTDLRLPHVDGIAVARYARSNRRHMPVFVVSSYTETMRAPHLVPPPVVFAKPVDVGALTAAIRRATHEGPPARPISEPPPEPGGGGPDDAG